MCRRLTWGEENEISLGIYLAGAVVGSTQDADLFVERVRAWQGVPHLLWAVPGAGDEEEGLVKLPYIVLVGILWLPNRLWNNDPSLESSGRNC